MKRIVSLSVLFMIVTAIPVSCYYDSEESLYPSLSSSCDTVNVTYSKTVVPMLENNCLGCHSAAAVSGGDGGGIVLDNYTDVKSQAVSISAAINQTGANSPMPKNSNKMKSCLIKQFDIWVRNGTPDN